MNTFTKVGVAILILLAAGSGFSLGDAYRLAKQQRLLSKLLDSHETTTRNASRLQALEESAALNWDLIEAQFEEAERLYRTEDRLTGELEKTADRLARANQEVDYLRNELQTAWSQRWAARDELYHARDRVRDLERQLRIAKHGVLGDAVWHAGKALADQHLAHRAMVADVLQTAFEPPAEQSAGLNLPPLPDPRW